MKKNTVKAFLLLSLGLGFGFNAMAQTPEQRAEIVKDYDLKKLSSLAETLKEKGERNYLKALDLAKENEWPLKYEDDRGRSVVLSGVSDDNKPIYITSDNDGLLGSARTSRVIAIRTGGSLGLDVNGQGMNIGMWEIGAPMPNHVDLTGRIVMKDGATWSSGDSNNSHATHVAGTLMGSGASASNARGIAYDAAELWCYNSIAGVGEAAGAALQGLLISNHSYGVPIANATVEARGAYSDESYDWDNVMYNAPKYQAVISAGNDNSGSGVKDLLIGNKNSKNAIVVAAVSAVPNYTGPSSVSISNFSSWGPTNDSRVKPDISAKGVSVISSWDSSTTASNTENGTSMAAPGIAGALTLLHQHYHDVKGEWMRAATLKGLMIATADEAGSSDGPDYKYGWGLINVERAAQLITNEGISSVIDERTLTQNQEYVQEFTVAGDGLKATICWTDFASTLDIGTTNALVLNNDFDLLIEKDGVEYLPWRLNSSGNAEKGNNSADNVEVVEANGGPGVYTLTVSQKGFFQGGSTQNYSLIINDLTDIQNVNSNDYSMFAVYPNPATDVINLKFDGAVPEKVSVVLYDLQGRVVASFNKLVDKIDISSLSAGMYVLNVESNGRVNSKKIVIE